MQGPVDANITFCLLDQPSPDIQLKVSNQEEEFEVTDVSTLKFYKIRVELVSGEVVSNGKPIWPFVKVSL